MISDYICGMWNVFALKLMLEYRIRYMAMSEYMKINGSFQEGKNGSFGVFLCRVGVSTYADGP